MSPGNYDKTQTPPGKRRAEKGTKQGAGKLSIYLDPTTRSAWRFLKSRVQRQALVTERIQEKARELGWEPPAVNEEQQP